MTMMTRRLGTNFAETSETNRASVGSIGFRNSSNAHDDEATHQRRISEKSIAQHSEPEPDVSERQKIHSCKLMWNPDSFSTADPADEPEPTTRPSRLSIPTTVDLCLFRVVAELCHDQVLPYAIRQMIKNFAFGAPFSDNTLREAVYVWCTDREAALRRYGDINDWDVSRVTSMEGLFWCCSTFNDCIDRWDVSKVTSMQSMFDGARAFNQPLASWDVSNVTDIGAMFQHAVVFNQPLDAWDVRAVRHMGYVFHCAHQFNQPLDSWDVSLVFDMRGTFSDATAFNQPLNSWDVSSVVSMCSMFYNAAAFNQPLDAWDVRQVVDMRSMFSDAAAFNQPLDTWDVRNVEDMRSLLEGASSYTLPEPHWVVRP